MTEIKIIIDDRGPMCGDCTSTDRCHFEKNPTLQEFLDYKLSNKREWGDIYINDRREIEYRHGEIVFASALAGSLKNQTVRLSRRSGGWTRMDYELYTT